MTSPEIQAIRERYKSSLPEKAEQITMLLDAVEQSASNAMDEAHTALHKLAGSSGMYGYDDIALLCRNAMVSAQKTDDDALKQQLTELITLLQQNVK